MDTTQRKIWAVIIVILVVIVGYFIFIKKIVRNPILTATSNSTKLYSNSQFGFEFQYPVNHSVENYTGLYVGGHSVLLKGSRFIEAGCDDCWNLEILPSNHKVAKGLKQQIADLKVPKKQISINGYPATEFWPTDKHWAPSDIIFIEHNNDVIYFSRPTSPDLQIVLTSFKFTK